MSAAIGIMNACANRKPIRLLKFGQSWWQVRLRLGLRYRNLALHPELHDEDLIYDNFSDALHRALYLSRALKDAVIYNAAHGR